MEPKRTGVPLLTSTLHGSTRAIINLTETLGYLNVLDKERRGTGAKEEDTVFPGLSSPCQQA